MPGRSSSAPDYLNEKRGAGSSVKPLPASGFSGTGGYAGARGDRDGVPSMCPDYLLALAVYLYPDADTPDGRRAIQDEAARELRRMARGRA